MTVSVLGFDELDLRTAYDVWSLRQQVFVVEQGSPYPDLDGRDREPGTRHLLLRESDSDELVGYARVLDDGDAVRIGRVVVARADRGRGLAGQLMREAMRLVGDRPARLDAQTDLARWYASYGFTASGPEFVEDGVAHLPMVRAASTSRPRPD
jgi:ElaA protein